MSEANHFNKRNRDRKTGKEVKTFDDFREARIRQSDGSYSRFKGGKLIAKEDAPLGSKFHVPTPVATIVAEPKEKEAPINRVRKNLDVNATAMRL